MKYFLLLYIVLSNQLLAKNLGVFGETFVIVEKDLLVTIQQKLQNLKQNGLLEEHQKKLQKQSVEQITNPVLINVVKTKIARVFTYNPSIKIPYDLKDHKGKIFAKAGVIINPLDYQLLNKNLLFIDGADNNQVNWAINHNYENNKIILVNGSPLKLMKKYQIPFYFDQGGTLITKFDIQQFPAKISQQGKYLKIEEIVLNEKNIS